MPLTTEQPTGAVAVRPFHIDARQLEAELEVREAEPDKDAALLTRLGLRERPPRPPLGVPAVHSK